MLFDLAPKTSKKDLYNFEAELEELYRAYRYGRVISIVGLRRVGKTSLVLTFLNEYRIPNIFIDCRRISLSVHGASFRGFAEGFSQAVNAFLDRYRGFSNRLLDILRSVRGVEVDTALTKISFRWGRRERLDLTTLLDRLNYFAGEEGLKLALVFDELQELASVNIDFSKLLAYIYDNLKNIAVVVTGSQIGLLYDLLGVEDPGSPLYGRLVMEVRVGRLPRDRAMDFLERGFREVGIEVDRGLIEWAVDRLDGVIGWLTYFGWSYVAGVRDVEAVVDMAARQEVEEVKRFLSRTRSERRYRAILKFLVLQKEARWSEIKRALEVSEGLEIDDRNFNDLLQRLVKAGLVERRGDLYTVADPILSTAIERYL